MTVVAVFGAKHSPGATTLALAFGALTEPDSHPLVIEADPAGGDIAARAGLPLDPGLLTLAAAGRRGVSPQMLDAHTQILANGCRVLVAPSSPEHAHAAVSGLAGTLGPLIRSHPGHTIIDVGRWDRRSVATDVLRDAHVVLALFRPTVEGVEHLRTRISALEGALLVPVMVGEHPYRIDEVRSALAIPQVLVLADDSRAASAVGSGALLDRWLRRSDYMRSVAALRDHLATLSPREVVAS